MYHPACTPRTEPTGVNTPPDPLAPDPSADNPQHMPSQPNLPATHTSTHVGGNEAGSSAEHGASAPRDTQHNHPTPEHDPTDNQTTERPDLTTYTTGRPCNIPVATPAHIPNVSACTNVDILDPRKIIALTFTAMGKPITPVTRTYVDRINRRTDEELEKDTYTIKKRKQPMMKTSFDTDPTTVSMIARFGRPTSRQRRTEFGSELIQSLYRNRYRHNSPTRSAASTAYSSRKSFTHDTPIT